MSRHSGHWAAQRERGSFRLMQLTARAVRLLGRRPLTPLIRLIVLYFYLTSARARRSIADYQRHLAHWSGQPQLAPRRGSVLAQFNAFAEALLDKLDAWNGRLGLQQVTLVDPQAIRARVRSGARGQLLVSSHLGNLEVCRALAEMGERMRMNVLVHTRHAEQFNRLLTEAGDHQLQLIQVSELDPATMLRLAERLERGEWLAIAGDRVPLQGARRTRVNFLGQPADLPQGPWLLAGLLECPVNLIHCLKVDGRYQVMLEDFSARVHWTRRERDTVIRQWAQRYADRLAWHCLQAPQQWFNFYPFWNTHDDSTH